MNPDAGSLDRLHDLVLPTPVPWWPPAPGWYGVIALALAIMFVTLVKGFIRWQHDRYRREALEELVRHEAALTRPDERAATLLALAELLKRTAITAFSRAAVAPLTGEDWFRFLDLTAPGTSFSTGLGGHWQSAIYDPQSNALDGPTRQELTEAIRRWIKNHRPC